MKSNTGFGNFYKECYCKYDLTTACQFDSWTATTNRIGCTTLPNPCSNPGVSDEIANRIMLNSQTSFLNGGLDVYLSTGFSQVLNITMLTKAGFGLSFRIRVLVCGEETISKNAGALFPNPIVI